MECGAAEAATAAANFFSPPSPPPLVLRGLMWVTPLEVGLQWIFSHSLFLAHLPTHHLFTTEEEEEEDQVKGEALFLLLFCFSNPWPYTVMYMVVHIHIYMYRIQLYVQGKIKTEPNKKKMFVRTEE